MLDKPAERNASVRIDVGNPQTDTATPGRDYTPLRNRLIRFRPGSTTAFVNIRIRGDRLPEPTETIEVTVRNGQNILIPGQTLNSHITVIDND